MNKFLEEIAKLWWVEVGTELQNPLSEKSIKGLRTVLKEEYDFDSDIIEYINGQYIKWLGHNNFPSIQLGRMLLDSLDKLNIMETSWEACMAEAGAK